MVTGDSNKKLNGKLATNGLNLIWCLIKIIKAYQSYCLNLIPVSLIFYRLIFWLWMRWLVWPFRVVQLQISLSQHSKWSSPHLERLSILYKKMEWIRYVALYLGNEYPCIWWQIHIHATSVVCNNFMEMYLIDWYSVTLIFENECTVASLPLLLSGTAGTSI